MSETKILQLKITLCEGEIEPTIWREILVRDDITTLLRLHNIIQDVFAWERSHFYNFHVNNIVFENLSMDMDDDSDSEDMKGKLLSTFAFQKDDAFCYLYDFGDGWEHIITVKNILSLDTKQKYPFCIGGERNRPPENSGGPFGYLDILEALADKKHEDYEEMYEYYGQYDSEKFSIDKANRALSKYHPKKQTKRKGGRRGTWVLKPQNKNKIKKAS